MNYNISKMPITQSYVAFHDTQGRSLKLGKAIACDSINSFSPIFAISAYLTKHTPLVLPPLSAAAREQVLLKPTQYFNPMLEAWNQHLTHCIVSGASYRVGEKFFILILLPNESLDALAKIKDFPAEQSFWEGASQERDRLQQIFGIQIVASNKRIGMFFNEPVSQKAFFTPKINACANLLGNLFNNQLWTIFEIPKGRVPTVEELIGLDAVLVTGSSYSVLNKTPQMQQAVNNLASALELAPKLKVVAICYGHQLILQHFGAEVVKKKAVDRLETIHLRTDEMKNYSFLSNLQGKQMLLMTQCHEDFVQNLPKGFKLLGSSQSCGVECTISEDGRVFTSQFHWELLYQSLERLFDQRTDRTNLDFQFELSQSQERIVANLKDSKLIIQMITEFLS